MMAAMNDFHEDELSLFASIVTLADGPGPALRRVGLLTPYMLETIAEDALRAGPGGSIAVAVPSGTDGAVLARVRRRLAALSRRGLRVEVCESAGAEHP